MLSGRVQGFSVSCVPSSCSYKSGRYILCKLGDALPPRGAVSKRTSLGWPYDSSRYIQPRSLCQRRLNAVVFSLVRSRSSPEKGKKVVRLKSPLPLKGSSRRRAYARSTVRPCSETSDVERSRAWGSFRKAQKTIGYRGVP